jgi:hypothetical protein
MECEDIADEIMGMMEPSDKPEIVVEILLMIIANVVSTVVSKCILDKLNFNKPNMIQKMKLWSYVKAESKPHGVNREDQNKIYEALLKRGRETTDGDIARLYAIKMKGK